MTSVNQGLSASEVANAVRDCFPKDSRVDRVQKLLQKGRWTASSLWACATTRTG